MKAKLKQHLSKFPILFNFSLFLNRQFVLYLKFPFYSYLNFIKLKRYYKNTNDLKIIDAIRLISKNKMNMFPFDYIKKYDNINYEIQVDLDGFKYVKYCNYNVYFPKKMSNKSIIKAIKFHLIEQDNESPHKYITHENSIGGDTAILVGASDGLFALEILNYYKHIYLIEADERWVIPLKKTFSNFNSKITIIKSFIGDEASIDSSTLNDIFNNYEYSIDFIQADVEGTAIKLLNGSDKLLLDHRPKISLACYHYENESDEIINYLEKFNYEFNFSDKFVYMSTHKLNPPFFRKGVVYAKHKDK